MQRPPLPPENIPGTHYCQRLSQPQGHSSTERIISMKNSNDIIGNRTRDLPTCSAVPQSTAPPRTYLLTPWCRVLLEKLTGLQLVKKFPAFHGTRRFITALTSVRHLSLSWASPIQSINLHPTSWRSILILSTHLRLGIPSGLLPSGFLSQTLYTPLSSPICAKCPAHLCLVIQ